MTQYVINHSRKVGKKPLENLGPVPVLYDSIKDAWENLNDLVAFIEESRNKFVSEEEWAKLGWPQEEIHEHESGYTVKLYDPEGDQFIIDIYQIHETADS